MTEDRDFAVGGMLEGPRWSIQYDVKVPVYEDSKPCPHCGPIIITTHKNMYGSAYENKHMICPRIVGDICLDCILEAVKGLEEDDV